MINLVDVIIPALNAQDFIAEALTSARAQRHVRTIIVVDNGSTDRTVEIASEVAGVTILREPRPGANYARNTALERVQAPFVKFLDADDLLEPNCLEIQLKCARDTDEDEIIYSNLILSRGRQSAPIDLKKLCYKSSGDAQLAEMVLRNIPISAPLYPTRAIKRIGGFDVKLNSRQEWNLNTRLALDGFRFRHCEGLSFVQRVHSGPERISNRQLNFDCEMQTLIRAIAPLRAVEDARVRDALAGYVWNTGLRFIWNGKTEQSRPFYDLARSIEAQDMHGRRSRLRRLLYKLFGPERAEIALVRAARCKKVLKKLHQRVLARLRPGEVQ